VSEGRHSTYECAFAVIATGIPLAWCGLSHKRGQRHCSEVCDCDVERYEGGEVLAWLEVRIGIGRGDGGYAEGEDED
jgi:hypothetical protein